MSCFERATGGKTFEFSPYSSTTSETNPRGINFRSQSNKWGQLFPILGPSNPLGPFIFEFSNFCLSSQLTLVIIL